MRLVQVPQFGGPEVLQIAQVDSFTPGPSEVVVAIQAAGVNPVDTYIRTGTHSRKPALPYTPGSDGAGVVKAVGAEVTQFKVGDRVFLSGSLSGTYGEEALCKPSQLHILPDNVSFQGGACLYVPYMTAYVALFPRGRAAKGETLFVHGGSGAVGLATIQLAKAAGLKIVASASSDAGSAACLASGADLVVNHRTAGYLDKVTAFTGGAGPDLIVEMLSNVNLDADLKHVAKHGRVAIVGCRGTIDINPRDIMSKSVDVLGVMLGTASEATLAEGWAHITKGLVDGVLKPVISKEFTFEQAADAHVYVLNPPGGACGNVVLVP